MGKEFMKVINLVEYISVDESVLLSVDEYQIELLVRVLLLFQDNDNLFAPAQYASIDHIVRGLSDFLEDKSL